MAQPCRLARKNNIQQSVTQTKNNLNRAKDMKERGMLIKYTLGENHLSMEASVGFPEEVTIELRSDSKIQLDKD